MDFVYKINGQFSDIKSNNLVEIQLDTQWIRIQLFYLFFHFCTEIVGMVAMSVADDRFENLNVQPHIRFILANHHIKLYA